MALVLLTGGARSGKSRLAAELAARGEAAVVVVVTGEASDDEMTERIRRHQAERPAEWTTVEAPIDLAAALREAPASSLVLVDCLSAWAANLMLRELPDEEIEARAGEAAVIAGSRPGGAIAVTNEVGAGVVPPTPLGRRYRDVLGRVNAVWAAAADRAVLVVAGRLLPLITAEDMWKEDERWTPS